MKYLVIGLGNPGDKYKNTRHNIGFIAIDFIAKKFCCEKFKIKFRSLISNMKIDDSEIILLKPQTFMNLSGEAVLECMRFYKINISNIIVIYDDVSLNPPKIRLRAKGSSGGQNGVKNIIKMLSSDEFMRIKIGVGEKPHKDYDLSDWVLSDFKKSDNIQDSIEKTFLAFNEIIKNGFSSACNKYNT